MSVPRLPIAFKLATSVACIVLLGLSLLALGLHSGQERQIKAQSYDYNTLITEQLAANAVEPLFTDQTYALQALINKIADHKQVLGAGIYDLDRKLVAHAGDLPDQGALDFDKPFQALQLNDGEAELPLHVEPVRFKGATAGYAVAVYSPALLIRSTEKAAIRVLALAVALFVVLLGVTLWFSRRATAPVADIAERIKGLESGQYESEAVSRSDELGELTLAMNSIADKLQRKEQLEALLDQVMTRSVADQLIDQKATLASGGQQVHASVVFADIVGFTNISESLSPREVSELLTEYFTYFEACAKVYFGSVDKFIGDCVMLVFGAHREDPMHEYHAVACAVLMQKLMQRLNQLREQEGRFTVDLRIGINSGDMQAGLLGSNNRLEYTVVGDAVNLASRLCNEAESQQIIIEESLYARVSERKPLQVEQEREIRVRGKTLPVSIYNVTDIDQINPFVMENLINDVLSMRNAA